MDKKKTWIARVEERNCGAVAFIEFGLENGKKQLIEQKWLRFIYKLSLKTK